MSSIRHSMIDILDFPSRWLPAT